MFEPKWNRDIANRVHSKSNNTNHKLVPELRCWTRHAYAGHSRRHTMLYTSGGDDDDGGDESNWLPIFTKLFQIQNEEQINWILMQFMYLELKFIAIGGAAASCVTICNIIRHRTVEPQPFSIRESYFVSSDGQECECCVNCLAQG